MNKILLILAVLLVGFPVLAAESSPLTYSRMKIKLIPKPEPKVTAQPLPDPKQKPKIIEEQPQPGELPTTKAEEKKNKLTKTLGIAEMPTEVQEQPVITPRETIEFTVDVYSPDYFDQDDVISQTIFSDYEGLLILIDPVAEASVIATRMLSTTDILFINEDGYITKIAPRLNVSTLSEPIPSGKPIRALLYLKAGSTDLEKIIPGDRFEGEIFKTHPVIVQ